MTRTERLHEQRKSYFWKGFTLILLLFVLVVATAYYYSQSMIKIEAPKEDFGRKVVIQLPNGNEVLTYEKLIVEENGKLYYQGENNKLDLTGGSVLYEEWE